MPSIGFPSTIARTYNSAAATVAGPVGFGWFWSYGMHVDPVTGGVTVIREDSRADLYTLPGDQFVAPPGIHDDLRCESAHRPLRVVAV